MIKAMIVDDEQSSIDLLKWLIRQYCAEITEIRTARSVQDALAIIDEFQPEIVFLDIQMPHQSGFDLLMSIKQWNFEVIFTTAYNEYAIQAIRFSALDYLLKPIDESELIKAISRYKAKRIFAPEGQLLFNNFIQNIQQEDKSNFKLALSGSGEIKYVVLQDIIRLQAESNYTRIYFTSGKMFLSAKTLKEYDDILKGHKFLRVHRSHLVNPLHIKSYDKQGFLNLSDDTTVEVSRRKKEYFQLSMGGKV
ncbi:MAG: LytTR family DNA-binding domain-containing protein [Saprospiraceae bacterium]